jgi:DNA-binding NtrC family response regulator
MVARRVLPCGPMDPSLAPQRADPRSSPSFEVIERALVLVAPLDVPVLVNGEPGSGRSVLARRLHQRSPRADQPCVRVDCRGLATRADAVGALEEALSAAAPGSILLEEVDLLAPLLQVKLMAWLEAARALPRAARVLATTQRDLEAEVHRGAFREDLRCRVDVFEIRIPPLRERRTEILSLARPLVGESAARLGIPTPGLPLEVEALLLGYPWPGNVRELRNAMERAVALSDGPVIEAAALPPRVLAGMR